MAEETKKGSWLSRNWGWLVLAGLALAGTIVGFMAYKRRKRTWEDASLARYFQPGKTDQTSSPWFNAIGFRFASKGATNGIKAGATVSITPLDSPTSYDVKVIEVWNDTRSGLTDKWVVITEPFSGWTQLNTDSGTLQLK